MRMRRGPQLRTELLCVLSVSPSSHTSQLTQYAATAWSAWLGPAVANGSACGDKFHPLHIVRC